jgi:hypothetical protein
MKFLLWDVLMGAVSVGHLEPEKLISCRKYYDNAGHSLFFSRRFDDRFVQQSGEFIRPLLLLCMQWRMKMKKADGDMSYEDESFVLLDDVQRKLGNWQLVLNKLSQTLK